LIGAERDDYEPSEMNFPAQFPGNCRFDIFFNRRLVEIDRRQERRGNDQGHEKKREGQPRKQFFILDAHVSAQYPYFYYTWAIDVWPFRLFC
jgi:hypothetical protein